MVAATVSATEPTLVKRLGSDRFRQKERVEAIAYSPDGKQIATADGNTVHIWQASDGRRLRSVTMAKRAVVTFAFSADGETISIISCLPIGVREADQDLQKWTRTIVDAASGEIKGTASLPIQRGAGVFSPDGRWFVLRDDPGETVHFIDVETGKTAWSYSPTNEKAHCFAYRPDGKTVAVGTLHGRITQFDPKSGDRVSECQLDRGAIWNMAFSPDGKDLVAEISSPGPNHIARLDAVTGTVRWRFLADTAKELTFVNEGKSIMFWGRIKPRDAHRWRWLDSATGKELDQTMDGDNGFTTAIRADGKVMAVGGAYGQISQWDLTRRKRIEHVSAEPRRPVSNLHFSSDAMMVRGWSQGWYEWDVKTGAQKRLSAILNVEADERIVLSGDSNWMGRFGPDVQTPRIGGHEFHLSNLATGERHSIPEVGPNDFIRFVPDGRLLIIGNHSVRTLDLATGKELLHIVKDEFSDAAASQDGSTVAIAKLKSAKVHVEVWNLKLGKKETEWTNRGADDEPWQSAFNAYGKLSPDGKRLAVQFAHGPGRDQVGFHVAVFETHTGRFLSEWMKPYSSELVFSPDGRSIAASDHSILGIDIRDACTGIRRARIATHPLADTGQFSADGRLFAVGAAPEPVEIWDLFGKTKPWEANKRDELWATLMSHDTDEAFRLIAHLRVHPTEAIALLKEKVTPISSPSGDLVDNYIKDLDSAEFRQREKATKELAKFGEVILVHLREALTKASPEARERLTSLIAKSDAMTLEKLRAIRACEVLEGIGNPDSKKLLAEWARGAPSATLTREAAESLVRLCNRGVK